jgi:hypothetical protein
MRALRTGEEILRTEENPEGRRGQRGDSVERRRKILRKNRVGEGFVTAEGEC